MSAGDVDPFCWVCSKHSSIATKGDAVRCATCIRSFHRHCATDFKDAISKHKSWLASTDASQRCPECNQPQKTRHQTMGAAELSGLLKHCLAKMAVMPFTRVKSPIADSTELFNSMRKLVASVTDFPRVVVDFNAIRHRVEMLNYSSTGQFESDVRWMLHTARALHIQMKPADASDRAVARSVLDIVRYMVDNVAVAEISRIDECNDCYANAITGAVSMREWFTRPCRHPHLLVWVEMDHGISVPAKLMWFGRQKESRSKKIVESSQAIQDKAIDDGNVGGVRRQATVWLFGSHKRLTCDTSRVSIYTSTETRKRRRVRPPASALREVNRLIALTFDVYGQRVVLDVGQPGSRPLGATRSELSRQLDQMFPQMKRKQSARAISDDAGAGSVCSNCNDDTENREEEEEEGMSIAEMARSEKRSCPEILAATSRGGSVDSVNLIVPTVSIGDWPMDAKSCKMCSVVLRRMQPDELLCARRRVHMSVESRSDVASEQPVHEGDEERQDIEQDEYHPPETGEEAIEDEFYDGTAGGEDRQYGDKENVMDDHHTEVGRYVDVTMPDSGEVVRLHTNYQISNRALVAEGSSEWQEAEIEDETQEDSARQYEQGGFNEHAFVEDEHGDVDVETATPTGDATAYESVQNEVTFGGDGANFSYHQEAVDARGNGDDEEASRDRVAHGCKTVIAASSSFESQVCLRQRDMEAVSTDAQSSEGVNARRSGVRHIVVRTDLYRSDAMTQPETRDVQDVTVPAVAVTENEAETEPTDWADSVWIVDNETGLAWNHENVQHLRPMPPLQPLLRLLEKQIASYYQQPESQMCAKLRQQVTTLTRKLAAEKAKSAALRTEMAAEMAKRVDDAKRHQWCSVCLHRASLVCCYNVQYCSTECQTQHWPSHRTACQRMTSRRQQTVGTHGTPTPTTIAAAVAPATVAQPIPSTTAAPVAVAIPSAITTAVATVATPASDETLSHNPRVNFMRIAAAHAAAKIQAAQQPLVISPPRPNIAISWSMPQSSPTLMAEKQVVSRQQTMLTSASRAVNSTDHHVGGIPVAKATTPTIAADSHVNCGDRHQTNYVMPMTMTTSSLLQGSQSSLGQQLHQQQLQHRIQPQQQLLQHQHNQQTEQMQPTSDVRQMLPVPPASRLAHPCSTITQHHVTISGWSQPPRWRSSMEDDGAAQRHANHDLRSQTAAGYQYQHHRQ